jgi:hypothetical protein
VVANNGNNNNNINNGNHDNDNDNGNENEDDQGNEQWYRRTEYHMHTYIGLNGQFCELLEELLQELDNTVRPLYVTRHYVEPSMRDYYTNEAHVRVTTGQARRWRTRTIHPSTTHFSSGAAAINDDARRALWSISNSFCDRIPGIDFCFVPSRASGTEDTVVPMGDFRDSHVDILSRVSAMLNTDLEGATAELDRTHEEIQNAQARIAQLEAQLTGQQPLEEAEASCPSRSPPSKRLRYGAPEAPLVFVRLGVQVTYHFHVSDRRSCEDERCNKLLLEPCLIWSFVQVSCIVESCPQMQKENFV